MKKSIMSDFSLIINLKYVAVILDKNDRPVCFGLCFPGFGKALQKSGGKLTLPTIFKILHAVKKPESIDLALIGILPEYRNSGISHAIFYKLLPLITEGTAKYAETNLMLTYNYNILNQWKNFNPMLHKRRRSYIKRIAPATEVPSVGAQENASGTDEPSTLQEEAATAKE